MKYENKKVKDIKIAYIGGGSRGWAWTFMGDLALEPDMGGTIALYDLDFDSAKQNEVIGNKISANKDAVGKWDYQAVKTLPEALKGADFVVISILPGTFDEMHSDVHLPERLGVYQSVGDTAGPGGIIRSLRTIPEFVGFAEAIKEHAPEAWVINYTNPMTICMKTLYHVFPEIKAFGCCHEVFGTQEVLKAVAEKELGFENVDRRDVLVNVLGINHFTWFDKASYKGVDLFPVYEKFVDENFEAGISTEEEHWANSSFACLNRVKFDLFKKHGYIAAAGDRHLAEFVSSQEYLKDPETVEGWNFGLTTVDWRKNDLQERGQRSQRLVAGEEEFPLNHSGEEGILLIKALCGLEQVISNVNIPNTNKQIPNLPADAIVETNAVFERDSIKPIIAGELPENLLNMIGPHVKNHDRILEAALTHNKELVLEAFQNDPLIKGQASAEELQQLVDDMIKNTLPALPAEWKKAV
ncbi:MAG: alpha-glucosidase/alpha-galactosidase [Turicibacter sp.]|nr:alpha-glucosidase/alpha-galactosidase [Turicibacter sp.]